MRRLVLAVLLVGLALLACGLWGLFSPAAGAMYPEAPRLYSFYALLAGVACLTVAATAGGVGRWRRRRRRTLLLIALLALPLGEVIGHPSSAIRHPSGSILTGDG